MLSFILCGVLVLILEVQAVVLNITPDELNAIDFSNIPEGANPAVVFVLPSSCETCVRYEKLLSDFSVDTVYPGDVYHVNSNSPWGILIDVPSVVLIDAERKLPYCGPPHHLHLINAIHQFSAGVRSARLDDANFEHDTQASTGGTTGDWLIIFDTMTEANLQIYDGLSLSLRARGVSLGIVDPVRSKPTAKRFNVRAQSDQSITVLMLHRSQLYRFSGSIQRTDFERLLKFAAGEFKEHPKSVIPRPRMRFDELLDWIVENYVILEGYYGHRLVLAVGSIVLLSLLCLIGLLLLAGFWITQMSGTSKQSGSAMDFPHEAGGDGGKHSLRKKTKNE
ncbi:hypothetical protein CRM22_004968 [Opisthorchis felineus]|uniref:Thioredoxin domain-containing protein n=2 Tax=Opisthorchis felineus TaxID=147828 RepID=A0A4S2LZ63_OPIFE|nr:hypothetical protein CRM22_004968 [Opisthorchis felineus]